MVKIRKAVIPIAGMGTRFLPVTKSIPKEMLPIVDKPTLQYIVEEAVNSGIEEILFITSSYKKSVEDYFDINYELENRLLEKNKKDQAEKIRLITKMAKFYYIRQGEPLGSGHAIKLAKSFVGNEPFAILYGDDLIDPEKPALKELIEMYEKTSSNILGVRNVPREEVNRYGIIEFESKDSKKINNLIEKPSIEESPSTMASIGRYIVNPEIFNELDKLNLKNGEYLFTDALSTLMAYQNFYACEFQGEYFDIGQKAGYLKANIHFGLQREELKQDLKDYLNKLY